MTLYTSYTFNPAAATIQVPAIATIVTQRVQLIRNLTRNETIYERGKSASTLSASGSTLALGMTMPTTYLAADAIEFQYEDTSSGTPAFIPNNSFSSSNYSTLYALNTNLHTGSGPQAVVVRNISGTPLYVLGIEGWSWTNGIAASSGGMVYPLLLGISTANTSGGSVTAQNSAAVRFSDGLVTTGVAIAEFTTAYAGTVTGFFGADNLLRQDWANTFPSKGSRLFPLVSSDTPVRIPVGQSLVIRPDPSITGNFTSTHYLRFGFLLAN
jgi:hypothetical protein